MSAVHCHTLSTVDGGASPTGHSGPARQRRSLTCAGASCAGSSSSISMSPPPSSVSISATWSTLGASLPLAGVMTGGTCTSPHQSTRIALIKYSLKLENMRNFRTCALDPHSSILNRELGLDRSYCSKSRLFG
jgi:hypothetical protein